MLFIGAERRQRFAANLKINLKTAGAAQAKHGVLKNQILDAKSVGADSFSCGASN